jgi:hypothetical protein
VIQKKKGFTLLLFCLLGFILPSCNLFTNMHVDGSATDASILVADGQAAMSRGDYTQAADYFEKAITANPQNSRARVGYAKAFLKNQGFNFANFFQTFIDQMDSGGSGSIDFINPPDWGCATYAEVVTVLTTVLDSLDPIARNLCDGEVAATDPTINLNAGFLYMLRVVATVKVWNTSAAMEQESKSEADSTNGASLGLTPVEYAAISASLPDTFWWVSPLPALGIRTTLQTDMDRSIARIQTAMLQSTNSQLYQDFLDFFSGLEILSEIP